MRGTGLQNTVFLHSGISTGNKTMNKQALEITDHCHSSEVQGSDGVTLNTSKDTNGISSNISGSEVTSMYYAKRELGCLQVDANPLALSVHSVTDMIPSKWAGAVDNCYHFGNV